MKIGYEAGRGKTFTPSMNAAAWTDEFNTLLNKGNMSRNALTEKLIIDGLKYNKQDHIILKAQGLSPRQAEILNSEAGQEILGNVLRFLLGESANVLRDFAEMNIAPTAEPVEEITSITPPKEVKPANASAKSKNNSGLDKLRSKVNQLNQVKNNLE